MKFSHLLLAACAALPLTAGATPNTDPMAARIVTADIDLFWQAWDKAAGGERAEVFRSEYLEKGSAGLRDFTRLRIGNGQRLAEAVAKAPRYYAAFRAPSARIAGFEPELRGAFRKLKDLYPAAVFPDVYFVVGRQNSAGTVSRAGLLIGAEMMGREPGTPEDELTPWLKATVKPISGIPAIVVHELVHVQQKPHDEKTLLARALREGICDFIGELVIGSQINAPQHAWAAGREKQLWQEFAREMHGEDVSNWMYQGEKATGERPADLGYVIGYWIAQEYYRNAQDKRQAVADILEMRDSRRFLAASRYAERMARP